MAKRKRASLKDTSPESLGLTPKKGKGIDLLFGGPVGQEDDAATEAELTDESAATTPLDAVDYGDRAVDELGLPVALEAPPDDLILATPVVPTASATGEVDAVNPEISPFAMPESFDLSDAGDATDLSGILEEDDSPNVEEETLADSEKDLAENLETPMPPTPEEAGPTTDDFATDLSGLVVEDTLPATAPTDDFSGIMGADEDLSGIDTGAPATGLPPAAPPPTTAAPINVPPPAYTPPPAPAVDPTPYTPPPPPVNIPPPSTATGAPSLSPPRVIESVGGIAAERTAVSAEDILPEDILVKKGDSIITVEKREKLERDQAKTEQIIKYIGPERRKKLDDEIEDLYQTVSKELSDNKEDAAFALKTLREAQEIVIEDISDYDDAIYRVAVVRTMLVRKQNLRTWSYTWGMVVFGYAIVWLAIFVAGMVFVDFSSLTGLTEGAQALTSSWVTALTGGIGGVIAILYSLSWRVAFKQEFDRQYIMKYLVQPIMGFILGAVIFFITSAGYLVFNPGAAAAGGDSPFFGSNQLIAIQIILGFIAGFRQRVVYYMIDKIVQKISPEETESKTPTSVVPADDYSKIIAERIDS
jgi:hypothetical protein